MFHAKFSLFSKTKPLENKIDLFHDKLLDAAMNFKKAIRIYLKEKRSEEYKKSTSKSNKSSMTPIISAVISKPNSIPRT